MLQRVLVSTSARQQKSPADPHGGRQATDKRRLAGTVLNQGRSPLSRASVAVEAGRFISMITRLSTAHPSPRRSPIASHYTPTLGFWIFSDF